MSSFKTAKLLQISYNGIIPVMAKNADNESLQAVALRLEEIREALGWQKQQIAAAIGATSADWSNYIKPLNGIPVDKANRLCVVAGVSTDFIYRGLFLGIAPEMRDAILKARAAAKTRAKQA
jgi:transcriptional regulator with XRE-family HTH domain